MLRGSKWILKPRKNEKNTNKETDEKQSGLCPEKGGRDFTGRKRQINKLQSKIEPLLFFVCQHLQISQTLSQVVSGCPTTFSHHWTPLNQSRCWVAVVSQ